MTDIVVTTVRGSTDIARIIGERRNQGEELIEDRRR